MCLLGQTLGAAGDFCEGVLGFACDGRTVAIGQISSTLRGRGVCVFVITEEYNYEAIHNNLRTKR